MGAADSSARVWTSGWAPGEGVDATFSYHPHDEDGWHRDEDPQLEYRDADLGHATSGKVGARFVRFAADAERGGSEWHAHDLDFELLYLQSGSLTIETEDGEQTLSAGDTCWMPPLYRHRISDYSPDFRAVELVSPARFERVIGRDGKLPPRAAELDPERRPVLHVRAARVLRDRRRPARLPRLPRPRHASADRRSRATAHHPRRCNRASEMRSPSYSPRRRLRRSRPLRACHRSRDRTAHSRGQRSISGAVRQCDCKLTFT